MTTEHYKEGISVKPKLPEWKVYFDGNFWGHHGRERAGKEIPLAKQFIWDGEVWLIPAIYTCSKGLVVDFCIQVPAERIRFFMDKWNLSSYTLSQDLPDGAYTLNQCLEIGRVIRK